jgi:hypothetical protein
MRGAVEYPPMGRCIYCGVTRYSDERETLAIEHIIPEALNGEMIIPEASCGFCEGRINYYEQFCMKATFGPLRYLAGFKTKRPNERPQTLPIKLLINDEWVTRDIPAEHAPVMMFMPLFDQPDIFSGRAPEDRNIYTKQFWHCPLMSPETNQFLRRAGATKGRSYEAKLDGIRFALLLAKIAHGFAMAERGSLDGFRPVLSDLVLRRPAPWPLAYFVGGITELEPATSTSHELGLYVAEAPSGTVTMVRVRLFSDLGAPTYYVVAGVDPLPPPMAT